MRPQHWIKNFLVFLPGILGHQIFVPKVFVSSTFSFLSFCSIASAGYIINDLIDLPHDMTHPDKKNRPLPSGAISTQMAICLALLLSSLSLAIGLQISRSFLLLPIIYLLCTTVYSISFKRLVLLDGIILAILFSTRIFAGSVSTDIPISNWLMSFSLFFFMSLAILKRFLELENLKMNSRKKQASGRDYYVHDAQMLSILGVTSGLISILVMCLYINSPTTAKLYAKPDYLWFLCILIFYWIGRIWILAARNQVDEDPIRFVIKDRATYIVAVIALIILGFASIQDKL
jgi:4-hydroxybenzoate polyprenyltransferase